MNLATGYEKKKKMFGFRGLLLVWLLLLLLLPLYYDNCHCDDGIDRMVVKNEINPKMKNDGSVVGMSPNACIQL